MIKGGTGTKLCTIYHWVVPYLSHLISSIVAHLIIYYRDATRAVLKNGNKNWYLVPGTRAVLQCKLVPVTWYQGGPVI